VITIEEPGLSGYTVCGQSDCVQTDAQGNFSLPNPSGTSRTRIKITDPNAENPALAMRYINNWKGSVVVPAYTKDVDAATMARLTTIPGCDADLAALVCKLNDATMQIRDQHLNDATVIPIENRVSIKAGNDNTIGLMQGFLTLPFVAEQVPKLYIFTYFDIDNNVITCGSPVKANGTKLNYDGRYHTDGGGDPVHPSIGVGDGHTGDDFSVPLYQYITNAGPIGSISFLYVADNGDVRYSVMSDISQESYRNGGSHLATWLVSEEQEIYRGQIIGLSDHSGGSPYYQLHFDLSKPNNDFCPNMIGTQMIDPFRALIQEPFPKDFSGSSVSYWTVDNLMQFP
jgi:hypothetical protein